MLASALFLALSGLAIRLYFKLKKKRRRTGYGPAHHHPSIHLSVDPTGPAWSHHIVMLSTVSSKSGNYKELDPELRKRLLEQCPELAGLEDALSAMGSDAADWLIDYNTLDIGYRIGSGTSSVVFRYDRQAGTQTLATFE